MAVSPEDLAAGALALQVFIKNAQYVEIIVNVAFATIPSILGIGAAGLIGHGIINTAKEVRNSISLLKTVGPMAQVGWMAGKGLGKGLRMGLDKAAERWPSLTTRSATSWLFKPPKKKGGENQDTQGKQEGQGGGGGGGNPPVPPDIKSDKKEEKEEIKNVPIHPSHDFPNPFKKKK
jgi:hypothetical protein